MSKFTEEELALELVCMQMQRRINSTGRTREQLEQAEGQVWDTQELGRDYEVIGFKAPFVVVTRKSDKKNGSLMFQHYPRFYWGWQDGV